MIAARRNAMVVGGLRFCLRFMMRHRFHGFFGWGLERARAIDGRSIMFCANHHNWWDGFVALLLTRCIGGRKVFLAQEEIHLRRYPFFRFAGAFGLDLATPSGALGGVREALGHLQVRDSALWIFPEGRLTFPGDPLEIRPGASFLSRKAGVSAVPVGIRYAWLSESKPGIYAEVGPPLPAGFETAALSDALRQVLARLDARLRERDFSGGEAILPLRLSANRIWDRLTGSSREARNS